MNYNVDDFEKFFKEEFEPWHFTSENVDDLVCEIERYFPNLDFDFEMGASKCVIVPFEADFVIKIPFDGEIEIRSDCISKDYDGDFYEFTGGGGEGWDYCDSECVFYENIIKNSGYEKFFLENSRIDSWWPVYIQKKAEVYTDSYRETSRKSKEMVKEVKKHLYTRLPNPWLELCLENFNFDVDKLKNFICFLEDNFSDLHRGNIGYIDNQAVIIDYAGFWE